MTLSEGLAIEAKKQGRDNCFAIYPNSAGGEKTLDDDGGQDTERAYFLQASSHADMVAWALAIRNSSGPPSPYERISVASVEPVTESPDRQESKVAQAKKCEPGYMPERRQEDTDSDQVVFGGKNSSIDDDVDDSLLAVEDDGTLFIPEPASCPADIYQGPAGLQALETSWAETLAAAEALATENQKHGQGSSAGSAGNRRSAAAKGGAYGHVTAATGDGPPSPGPLHRHVGEEYATVGQGRSKGRNLLIRLGNKSLRVVDAAGGEAIEAIPYKRIKSAAVKKHKGGAVDAALKLQLNKNAGQRSYPMPHEQATKLENAIAVLTAERQAGVVNLARSDADSEIAVEPSSIFEGPLFECQAI